MEGSNKIGQRIKELREKKGLTQQQLANELHVKRETVNLWENGFRDLKTGYTIALAEYFKVDCDYLLRGISAKHAPLHEITMFSEKALDELYGVGHDKPEVFKPLNEFIENGRIFYRVFGGIATAAHGIEDKYLAYDTEDYDKLTDPFIYDTNYVIYRIVNYFDEFVHKYLDTIAAQANAALQERRKSYDVNETKRMRRQREIETQIEEYDAKIAKGDEPTEGIVLSNSDIMGRNDVP